MTRGFGIRVGRSSNSEAPVVLIGQRTVTGRRRTCSGRRVQVCGLLESGCIANRKKQDSLTAFLAFRCGLRWIVGRAVEVFILVCSTLLNLCAPLFLLSRQGRIQYFAQGGGGP